MVELHVAIATFMVSYACAFYFLDKAVYERGGKLAVACAIPAVVLCAYSLFECYKISTQL